MSNIVEYIQKFKNVSIVNDLLSKYEYTGNNVYTYLFHYLMYKKYNLDIPPESLFCYSIDSVIITNGSDQIFEDIANYFQHSNRDKSFLKLEIDLLNQRFNHSNLIIYNRQTETLEHYEPNGYLLNENWGVYGNYVRKVVSILYTNLKRYMKKLNFKSSEELHGFSRSDKEMLGLQGIEGRHNYKGHCQIWCYLIADLITKFPEHSTESIITTYLDLNNHENLSKHNLHRKLKMIVRGFYFSSIRKINKMDELGNLDIESLNSNNHDVLIETRKLIKNNVFRNLYGKSFISQCYSNASVVKSYILAIGFEKTKSIFEYNEDKKTITSIYEKMMNNRDEQFLVD
jgi:hypothetical protein